MPRHKRNLLLAFGVVFLIVSKNFIYAYNKRIYYFKHSVENAVNSAMKRIVERANAEITYSVREEERSNPVTVTFTEWG
ncbi:hypothetical protein PMEGAS70_53260 [Priestia megaterium]